MTQRERQLSEGAAQAAARPALGSAPPSPPERTLLPWDEIFLSATPSQQAQLLNLAQRQGLLHGHQLPLPMNGPPRAGVQRFLARVLTGEGLDLDAVRAAPLDAPALDAGQREAVARALATPDLCLIQGLPVTGKSRVAAEIIARAAERGERVLLVAPRAASVDRVLELLHGRSSVCAVRVLERDEDLSRLSSVAAGQVFSERLRRLHEQTSQTAARQKTETDQRCAGLAAVAPIWPHLLELAERAEHLEEQANALARRREGVPGAVEAIVARLLVGLDRDIGDPTRTATPGACADTPFEAEILTLAQAQRQTAARLVHAVGEATARVLTSKVELDRLNGEQDGLAPLAEAKAGGRWWTATWWRATVRGNVAARATELQSAIQRVQHDLARLEEEAARLIAERRQSEEKERAERTARTDTEIARRREAIEREEAALQHEKTLIEANWRDALRQIQPETRPPEAATVEAVREAHGGWQRSVECAAKRRVFATEWQQQVQSDPQFLARELRTQANLVAVPLGSLTAEPQLKDLSGGEPMSFDLLIVDHAEQITEAEFVTAAERCRRWVLITESVPTERVPSDSAASVAGTSNSRPRAERRKPRPVGPSFFQRLWARLHCDPCRLPYSWQRETDARLCCRLRALSPEQRRWIEIERVADFPDIELRIVAPPRGGPSAASDSFLAEVVFPPHMSVLDAKSYIFRELEEVAVRAHVPQARWLELPERLVLTLTRSDESAVPLASIPLAQGVREVVANLAGGDPPHADGWVTHAVEFERAAGWERERAEAWAARHLGLYDLGRTAFLDAPQGYAAGLAPFLSDVLFGGGYCPGTDGQAQGDAPVEFISVPPLPRGAGRGQQQRRQRLPSGAGLETDPVDPRRRDHLPAELHARLGKARGLVNFLEAQAVVRAVKRLAIEHGPGAARSAHRSKAADLEMRNGAVAPLLSVGVVALYPAQAQLVRLLLEPEADFLANAGLDVCVDEPGGFHERECAIAVVSLTRSHTHRAASFGEGPYELAAALTRGRSRLVLLGDPGTLARRAEWHAPVDHLDEAASARERAIVARLVQYIQGEGKHRHRFHLRHDNAHASAGGGRGVSVRGVAARESSSA